MLVPALTILC
uniref:Uncharacterized protein n=1 Tax=Arundo donax TaxID=35708 RepID=A0A0A9GS75_ARUDO